MQSAWHHGTRRLRVLSIAIVCITLFNANSFAQWWPDLAKLPPAKEEPAIRSGAVNLDINYPGVGVRYFLSDQTAIEGRAQYDKKNFVAGPRLYWYPPLFPAGGKFSPYLCAEGDYVSFKDSSTKGSGWAGGAFAGVEYSLSRAFSLQMDTGVNYFSIKDKGTALTQNELEFALNFGVNFYIGSIGSEKTPAPAAREDPYR